MAYTCGWDSLPVRFKVNFLELCWVCAPPRDAIPSILLYHQNAILSIFEDYFLLQFYLFFYSILISFQICTFYTFGYSIESSKVWKKPKYNSLSNKCLIFDIHIDIEH